MNSRSFPISWLNRYKDKKLLCRNLECDNRPHIPYQFYCSDKCRDESQEFELSHYPRKYKLGYLETNKPCNKCGQIPNYSRYYNGGNWDLELDHKTPFVVVYMRHFRYWYKRKRKNRKNHLYRDKYMRMLRDANHPDNLQWLCKECHKKKTKDDLILISKEKRVTGFDDSVNGKITIPDHWEDRHTYKHWGFLYYVYQKYYRLDYHDDYVYNDNLFSMFDNRGKEYFVYCLMFADQYSDVMIRVHDIESLKEIEEWGKSIEYKLDLEYMDETFKQKTILDYFVEM